MKSEDRGDGRAGRHVAVVGAGFSGTMLAAHLVAQGCRVTLIDGSGRFAEGLAYSTREPAHLLNVCAANMSAFVDRPDHLVRWLEARNAGDGATYAPRLLYRAYLNDILREAGHGVECLTAEVVALAPSGLLLASGARLEADVVVVAAGNLPPEPMAMFGDARVPYVNTPWSAEGRAGLAALAAQGGALLIVGTGLTMVDTVLMLDAQGFSGPIIALSRRGLLPRPHAPMRVTEVEHPTALRPLDMLRWLRRQARAKDWRVVVDSLRPISAAIWQSWSQADRARFLRHLRPWWDVHRHRIAPKVWQRIGTLIKDGRLSVRAGRVVSVGKQGLFIRFRGEGSTDRLDVAGIVNCTGPQGDVRRSRNRFVRDLLDSGRAKADPLGLGLQIDGRFRVVRADGLAADGLYAIGPMTMGAFWEIVAVPDIREQAQQIAAIIGEDLDRREEAPALQDLGARTVNAA